MIDIFIIDDHPIFIQGVTEAIKSGSGKVRVIGSATSFNEMKEKILSFPIDVVLLDLVMPEINGIECFSYIKQYIPEVKVIALTGEMDTTLLLEAWLKGVDAIMPKYCGKKELLQALNQVLNGQRFLGDGLPNIFKSVNIARDAEAPNLTRREEEVLKILASGVTRSEASEHLHISIESVKFHCKNIFKKFDKGTLKEVLIEARKYKIIP
jgi:DNA-binding NarL/FixJ family response regulator